MRGPTSQVNRAPNPNRAAGSLTPAHPDFTKVRRTNQGGF
nr:MAG TPA: hypothetical protein [Caudoviricetes sp.]